MTEAVSLTPEEATVKALEFYNLRDPKWDKEAELLLRSVLMVDLDSFDAHNILGAICIRRKNFYEAHYHFCRTTKIDPLSGQAMSNLGMVLCHFEHFDEAIDLFNRSLETEPNEPAVLSNLATLLQRKGRDAEALKIFDRVVEIDPGRDTTFFNKGICFLRLGRLQEAISHLDEAVRIGGPEDTEAYYNRGIARLSYGDFDGGWPDYERRTVSTVGPYYVGPFTQPKWTGEQSLTGKRILVHAEQGMGDSIQFMRYIPLLQARGAHVVMIMHDHLHRLARSLGAEVLIKGSKIPDFDYWSPTLSLPLAFKTTEATMPPPAPFTVDTSKYAAAVSSASGSRLRVGVCWSGNWQHKNDLHRSIDLSIFSRLFQVPGVAFFNLQKDVRPMELEEFKSQVGLFDFTGSIEDMADTTSLISNLDLVITCDTCIAHIAGGVVPTWNLIPAYNTDWRWMRGRNDSPWYPMMRLYRQDVQDPSAWPDVISRVAADLHATTERKVQ